MLIEKIGLVALKWIRLRFPNELKVLLKHHNGEGPFLNSDMIITEVYKLNRLFNEMAYKQLSNEKYIDKLNKILPVAYSPQWYPFYNDMTYTYAIDLLPGKNGDMGQVILLGKDEEPSTFVAKDLETFLELYLNKKVKMDVSSWQ